MRISSRAARLVGVAGLVLALAGVPGGADPLPGLGQPWDPAGLPPVLTTIHPDGRGLPDGAGTALEGAALYADHCAACHGASGVEGPAARLVGGDGWIGWDDPLRPWRILSHPILLNGVGGMWPEAPALFAYIRRAMPLYAPKTLADPEVFALTAWILWRNGLVGEAEPMSRATLPAVVMPGRARIVPAWPEVPDGPGP